MSSSDKIILPTSSPAARSNGPSTHITSALETSLALGLTASRSSQTASAHVFNIYNSELLPALAYPYAGFEELRTCCDFINLLFVFDEISDELAGGEARELGVILLKAIGRGVYQRLRLVKNSRRVSWTPHFSSVSY